MTFSETFLVFLVILVVFLGVKFGFRKSCLCKRNDKYKVCSEVLCFCEKYLTTRRVGTLVLTAMVDPRLM